jgi:hypothetical protein
MSASTRTAGSNAMPMPARTALHSASALSTLRRPPTGTLTFPCGPSGAQPRFGSANCTIRSPSIDGERPSPGSGRLSVAVPDRDRHQLPDDYAPLLAIDIGVALVVPSINTALLAHVSPSFTGITSGVLNTARQIGGALGVGVFGGLGSGGAGTMVEGLHVAVVVAGVLMAAGASTAIAALKNPPVR